MNVDKAADLIIKVADIKAKAELVAEGITNPTKEQINQRSLELMMDVYRKTRNQL